MRVVYGSDPSPASPSDGPEWDRLAGVIAEVFPDALVAPYVMLQASDSRHFARISDTVYRFLPFDLTAAERGTLHAIDESIRGVDLAARDRVLRPAARRSSGSQVPGAVSAIQSSSSEGASVTMPSTP